MLRALTEQHDSEESFREQRNVEAPTSQSTFLFGASDQRLILGCGRKVETLLALMAAVVNWKVECDIPHSPPTD